MKKKQVKKKVVEAIKPREYHDNDNLTLILREWAKIKREHGSMSNAMRAGMVK